MLILVPTYREARLLFDGRVPGDERPIRTRLTTGGREVEAALSGFGLAAAGVMASRALSASGARRCLLAGIAGTYQPDLLPVGSVLMAVEARTGDIGRGRGRRSLGPADLGLVQAPAGPGIEAVVDRIALPPALPALPDVVPGVLLTVAAASATPEEASERAKSHPDVLAEDMEGFAVALAASRAAVRLDILRGISNVAGVHGEAAWDVAGAMAAVGEALAHLLTSSSPRPPPG